MRYRISKYKKIEEFVELKSSKLKDCGSVVCGSEEN